MKKGRVVEFSDFLFYGEEKGYDWNDLCDRLEGINPQPYGVGSYEMSINEIDEEYNEWKDLKNTDPEMFELVKSFFIDKKLKNIVIVGS